MISKLNFTILFAFILTVCSYAQPEDCGIPSPPGADDCEDACVYCDLTENGYTGSTIGYTPDAPNIYCGTIENNQWFAFAAGTTTVEFTITPYNCSNGDGVQGAIYPDCDPNSPYIVCEGGMNNGCCDPIVVTATGLEIGEIYWFMVDGWLGDECDYDVEVTQGNTDPPPLDPPGPIDAPDIGCTGQTVTFSIPDLPGASYYEWTLPDNTVINGQETSVEYTFGPGGTVCVTASNVCHFSEEVCITIDLLEPEAGDLDVNPNPLCPGETANILASNYNIDPEYTQNILIADENGIIIDIIAGGSGTFTHDTCSTFTVCSYNYVTDELPAPVIGDDIDDIDCDEECCDIVCEDLVFEDLEAPVLNGPADETFTCVDLVPPMEDLAWTDNCDGTGLVSGEETGTVTMCQGGDLIRTWEYIDECGNVGIHEQTITVEPAEPPEFVDPPADETVTCENAPTGGPDLDYSNGGQGDCLIEGTITPTESGSSDICGGTITYTWDYTDECGNNINHVQNITIEPAPAPEFINPPADVTLVCDTIPTSGPVLAYTNFGTGDCLIEGTVTPTESGNADICGGTITYTWDYTDPCGNNINHVQNVTIEPAPLPQFIDPPADVTVDCDNIPTGAPDLDYTNNGLGECLLEGTVSPVESGSIDICGGTVSYKWDYVDPCGNEISHTQNITVDPAPLPQFIDPPADVTLDCDNIPTEGVDLDYTNNGSGDCLFEGTITPTESGAADICGGTITYTWDYTDPCGNNINHVQNITIDPAPLPQFDNPPADVTVDCDNIPTGAPDLNYTNNGSGDCLFEGTIIPTESGNADICGGTLTYTWDYTDPCGNNINHVQNITVDPAPIPAFIDPPADVTVNCDNIPTGAPDLDYTNNGPGDCLIEGTISPSEEGQADICGGTLTYRWQFTDQCGNEIQHLQNVTVEPAPVPEFIDPPADVTVNCDNIPTGGTDLDYTNNGSGDCLFEGSISPTETGNADICGGTLTYTWEFTDPCGNNINHVQNITVDPAPIPEFIDPPADVTVDCDNIPTGAPDLDYTNNGPGDCLIEGSVSPTESGNADICGGTLTYTWEFTDPCGNNISHVQNITVDPAPEITFIDPPQDMQVSCNNVPDDPGDLSYTNNGIGDCLIEGIVSPVESGSYDECGGTIMYTWEYTSICGQTITHVQNIDIEPAPPAEFTGNLPQDLTTECDDVPPLPPPLDYTNNESGVCLIEGSAPASQSGSYDECGGEIIFTWEFIDDCGRTIQHQQTVTVDPAPEASFTNPPGPTTMDCSEIPPNPPSLDYTNGLSGTCEISGSVTGIQSGSYDFCGGVITYTWVFTDDCNRTINHSQVVNVNPASDPYFTTLPPDITIDCGADLPTPMDLPYTNDETGLCTNQGTVPPTIIMIDDLTWEYTWSYTNPCNNATIEHTQTITENPAPEITLFPDQAVICEGDSYDLSTISVTDINNTNLTITYHSSSPPTSGNELPSSEVNPLQTTIYFILATNEYGCTDEAIFSLFVEEPPFAGLDGTGYVCYEFSSSVNMFDFLNGNPPLTGQWLDVNNYGINLTNPFSVDFSGFPPGEYTFDYVVSSNGVCPDDVASATVDLLPPVFIDILEITCTDDLNFYEVLINNSNGYVIAPSAGNVTDLGNDEIIITDIPIDQSIIITAFDPLYIECVASISVNPPNCDCPNVDPPVNDGDASICEGETNPELSVTVGPNETANWYSDSGGNTLLLGGSTTYTSDETTVGVYIYYVEAENLIDGCVSSILTPVQFEIFANPTGNDAQLNECDNDSDGFVLFDLTQAEDLISLDPGYTFTFYETLIDAQNGTNPLQTDYTNTSSPTQDLFVLITDVQNCTEIVQLTLVVEEIPSINFDIVNEACLGEGNGSVSVSSNQGYNYSLDSIDWTTETVFDSLESGNYTIYAEGANGCIASEEFEISPGLELELTSFEINCDNNGTASDASDDFYTIVFTLNNSLNNPGTYTVNDGSSDLGTFDYDVEQTIILDALGQTLTFTFSDDILGCPIQQTVGPLNPCSTDCTISINELDFECSDNGTPSDPADDFYTVSINASAINGSSNNTYNVLINGVLFYNFGYDLTSTFTVPADGTSPTITVVDNEDDQCQDSQTIGPLTPCSDQCVISFASLETICNDNGTISNQSDDFYEITINASALNGSSTNNFIVFVDGIQTDIFTYGVGGTIIVAADGSSPIISIVDEADPNCTAEQQIGPLDPCTDECVITATISNIECDNQGTANDSSDDTYTFDLSVSGQNVSGGWMTDDGNYSGNYGDILSLGPFLISNGDQVLIIQDNDNPDCSTEVIAVAPPACSDPCEITFTLLEVLCNDNGTISVLTDDFYEITINASATNAGSTNNFNVLVNGVQTAIFEYGIGGTFTLPADGSSPTITIVDATESYCLNEQQIGPLVPCNDPCEIQATINNIECNDQGTGIDPDDDTFTFEVVVNGQNISAGWELDDGSVSGIYGIPVIFGPYLISDGNQTLIIQDSQNPDCNFEITAIAPAPCSNSCEISLDLLNISCNDNGTVSDQTDDFYEITINASAINGGPNNIFNVLVDGNFTDSFTYGTGGMITIPADGSSPIITIVDETIGACFVEQQIGPLVPCTDECLINASISNIDCDDQGTGNDPNDDTFSFDILVTGQNTSTGWVSASSTFSGTYGVTQSLGPFLITNGDQTITILDNLNPDCSFDITAIAPPSCSDCVQSADAGLGATLTCENETAVLNGSTSEPGDYLWTGPNMFEATTLSVVVAEAGTYYFTVTYPNNCTVQDSVIVDINDNTPIVDAGPDQIITCDVEQVYLDGSMSSQGTDILYFWTNENGDTISQDLGVTVSIGGTYYLQLVDSVSGCASPVDAAFVVDSTALPLAIIYAEPQNILDCVVGSILLYSIDQENVEYTWGSSTNTITTPQIIVSEPDTYTLQAVDTITGCENFDFIIIEDFQDYPFVNINPTDTLSCYTPEILLDATGSQTGPNIIYNWFDNNYNLIIGENGDTLLVDDGGFYSLQLIDTTNGCENADTVFVESLLDQIPVAIINQTGALDCDNSTLVLDGTGSVPFNNLTFEWSTQNGNILSGGTTPNPEIDQDGDYILTVTDVISGCTNSTTINIVEDTEQPIVIILPPGMINCYEPEIELDGGNSTSIGNLIISWNSNPPGGIISGDTTLTPVINQGGTYTLTIENLDNGCTESGFVLVDEDTELPIAVANVDDDLDCITEEIIISGLGSSEGSEFSYSWSGPGIVSGNTTLQPTIDLPGNYTITVFNSFNGCLNTDQVLVIENTNVPTGLNALVNPPVCYGDQGSIEIISVDGGEGPYIYSIDGGLNFNSIGIFASLDPGDYTVLVQDANGCEYEDFFFIPSVPELLVTLEPEIIVQLGESTQIIAFVNIALSDIDTIVWTPTEGLSCTNCLNPSITPLNETLYTVTVTDLDGCTASDQIMLRVRKDRDIYIPNAFSPHNNDGINDIFMIFGNEKIVAKINSFQVFDRWGELVWEDFDFQPNDPAHSWDGKLKGQPMNPAVFVYWAEIEFIDGVKKLYKGDVTLLR